jgi:hypothetical protein
METGDVPFAQISATIVGLNVNYTSMMPNQWTFSPQPMAQVKRKPQIDADNIQVILMITRDELGDPLTSSQRHGNLTMKKEDITRMNLVVGDAIMLKVTKVPHGPEIKDV